MSQTQAVAAVFLLFVRGPSLTRFCRFGWVNASYVYGLQIVSAHMRRALGTLTPYETFVKALDENKAKALSEMA